MASGFMADRCGPHLMAALICSSVHAGPVSTGHPFVAPKGSRCRMVCRRTSRIHLPFEALGVHTLRRSHLTLTLVLCPVTGALRCCACCSSLIFLRRTAHFFLFTSKHSVFGVSFSAEVLLVLVGLPACLSSRSFPRKMALLSLAFFKSPMDGLSPCSAAASRKGDSTMSPLASCPPADLLL